MTASTALISDKNKDRASNLQKWLGEFGIESMEHSAASQHASTADIFFVAADGPSDSCLEETLEAFAQRALNTPIVVLTEAPLWELITRAVRKRAWMDVPHTRHYHDLLSRYAISRSPRPKIIVEGNPDLCDELMNQWQRSPNGSPQLRMTDSLGEAFEMALNGRASALLNTGLTPGAGREPGISTLVYSLSPTVIAVMIEACSPKYLRQRAVFTNPDSRFALLRSPYSRSNIELLLNTLSVDWPSTTSP